MVARSVPTYGDSSAGPRGTVVRLFLTWRVALTRLGQTIVRTADGTMRHMRSTAAEAAESTGRTVDRTVHASRNGLTASRETLRWLFDGWRRVVTRLASALRPRQRLATVAELAVDAGTVLRKPTSFGSLSAPAADRVAGLGLRAFLLGTTGAVLLGWATAGSPGSALAATLNSMLWAGARLIILVALAPRNRQMRAVTVAAWSVSLLPYALGVTEGLRVLALGGSAMVCLGALEGVGVRTGTARTMTAWAFGGQAGVLTLGWLLRGVLAILAAL